MSENLRLIKAQMHAECLNEAWCELMGIGGAVTEERKKSIQAEIGARVWAVIYLIQESANVSLSEDAIEVIREANSFNGVGLDEEIDIQGMH